jgi:MFS family permease
MIANPTDHDPAYGWVMVAAVFVLSTLSFGALGAISVFLKPLAAEFGWSRGETSLGYTTIAFSSALFGIFWGWLADRAGTRWFGTVAAFVMPISLVLLSQQTSIIEFYCYYFLFGAFGSAVVGAPLFANVGFWFTHNPGLALGVTAAGGAFGQGVVPYFSGMLIESGGWRSAYLTLAVVYFLIALPTALLIRESPMRLRAQTDTMSDDRDRPISDIEVIVWICCAIIFCCICMALPIVHLVPLLTDTGTTTQFATSVLLVLMMAGVAGRIMGGKLGDMIGPIPAYMLMSLGQTVFVFWFPPLRDGTVSLYLLAIFFGFTYSGVMSCILVCTRKMVSARLGGRAMSITSFFGWGGMGLGGFLGGYVFDVTGDYGWSFALASAAGVINLIILILFWLRIGRARAEVVPALA